MTQFLFQVIKYISDKAH